MGTGEIVGLQTRCHGYLLINFHLLLGRLDQQCEVLQKERDRAIMDVEEAR